MRQMGIDKFEYFAQKLNTVLDQLDSFCASVEVENRSSNNSDIDEIIERLKKLKRLKKTMEKLPKKKLLPFCMDMQFVLNRQTRSKGNFPVLVNFCPI